MNVDRVTLRRAYNSRSGALGVTLPSCRDPTSHQMLKFKFPRSARRTRTSRVMVAGLALSAGAFVASGAQTTAPLAPYRARLLGVFNAQTGDPIEGAEVLDVLSKTKALTTATGTVTTARATG